MWLAKNKGLKSHRLKIILLDHNAILMVDFCLNFCILIALDYRMYSFQMSLFMKKIFLYWFCAFGLMG